MPKLIKRNGKSFYVELAKKGMNPTRVVDTKNGRQIENIIFPYALVSAGGYEVPVLLLKGTQGKTAEEKLNQSNENVEYELATAIRKLTLKERKKNWFIGRVYKAKTA
jgi:ABC-2 type transport system permease protein